MLRQLWRRDCQIPRVGYPATDFIKNGIHEIVIVCVACGYTRDRIRLARSRTSRQARLGRWRIGGIDAALTTTDL